MCCISLVPRNSTNASALQFVYNNPTHPFFFLIRIHIPIPWLPHPQRKIATINFLKLASSAQIHHASSSTFYLSNATTVNFLSARTISRLMFTSVRNTTRTNLIESLPTVCLILWNHIICILLMWHFLLGPLCNIPVAVRPGQDPNVRMDMHLEKECSVVTGKIKSKSTPTCARGNCKKVLFSPINCDVRRSSS